MRLWTCVVAALATAVCLLQTRAQALGCSGSGSQILGTLHYPDTEIYRSAFDGTMAYLIKNDGGVGADLIAIDYSDPTSPAIVGTHPIAIPIGGFESLAVGDGLAMYGGESVAVYIVDVSDPTAMSTIGTYQSGEYVTDIEINGSTAYLTSVWDGLEVVDMSDPTSPVRLGGIEFWIDPERQEHLNSGFVSGDRAYLTTLGDGVLNGAIKIIDISDPTTPTLLGEKRWSCCSNLDIRHVAGDLVYVSLRHGSFAIYDFSDPADIRSVYIFSSNTSFVGFGDRAYKSVAPTGNPTDLLEVYDISDAGSPVLIGTGLMTEFRFPEHVEDGVAIQIESDALYVCDYSQCPPCTADVTTTGAGTGDPGYGVPDGDVTGADINYFVNAWVALDTNIADLTTQGAADGEPGFGVPDGLVTGADISYFVNLWIAGCP